MSEEKYIMLRIDTGEIVLSQTKGETEKSYILYMPVIVVPIPPEQAGGQENQIGFGKFMPFANYDKPIEVNKRNRVVACYPDKALLDTYKKWAENYRAKKSNIIIPRMSPPTNVLKNGNAQDFSKLNIGR